MSHKEFKQPIGRGSTDKAVDVNMLSGEQNHSGSSNKTISGFGAYKTRNYNAFAAATSKVLTRNRMTEVINNRPSLEKIIDK